MPAASSKVLISPAVGGAAQAAVWVDALRAHSLAVGDTVLANQLNDGVANIRSFVHRLAKMDPHYSRVDLLPAYCTTTNPTIWPICDADILKQGSNGMAPAAAVPNIIMWAGKWSGASWPNLGTPTIDNSVSFSTISFDFDTGVDGWTCRFVGSEYGHAFVANNGSSGTEFQMACDRPTDTRVPGRNIEVIAGVTGGPSYTFGAATGVHAPYHLIFESDGRDINVQLPATAVSLWQVARAITMAAGGFIAGVKRNILPGNELLVARIPQDRFPSAGIPGVTGVTPRIRLKYQDPAFVAQGINFGRFTGIAFDAGGVTTGARGTLARAASNFVANRVRVGSYVYNRNIGDWAEVKAFKTTTNPCDTIICDNVPGAWTDAHSYDVYPFCDHGLGTGVEGGLYQGARWDPTDDTAAFDTIVKTASPTTTKVVLNDLYGEAQGHYSIGQNVLVMNNGCAVILEVDTVAGFVLGETVINPDTGARGVIRAIDTTSSPPRLLVDTFQGRVLAIRVNHSGSSRYYAWNDYNNDAVQTWDRVQSDTSDPDSPAEHGTGSAVIGSGLSGTYSSTKGYSTEGQSGLITVLAVTQAKNDGGAADDYRTVLTLDTNAAQVNAGFEVFPSAVIGARARIRRQVDDNWRYHYVVPHFEGDTLGNPIDTNIRVNERAHITGGNQPTHTPDAETSSYDLAALMLRLANTKIGYGDLGSYAHMRAINPAAPNPINAGDGLPEQGDIQRLWVAVSNAVYVDATPCSGARTTDPVIQHRLCIGPSDSTLK